MSSPASSSSNVSNNHTPPPPINIEALVSSPYLAITPQTTELQTAIVDVWQKFLLENNNPELQKENNNKELENELILLLRAKYWVQCSQLEYGTLCYQRLSIPEQEVVCSFCQSQDLTIIGRTNLLTPNEKRNFILEYFKGSSFSEENINFLNCTSFITSNEKDDILRRIDPTYLGDDDEY